MPIFFRSTPVSAPYMFDSIGNHWLEEETCRPEGYPHYHYLQTETGCGEIEIQGKIYELQENEGFLIAPSIPHSYKENPIPGSLYSPHLPEHWKQVSPLWYRTVLSSGPTTAGHGDR